jgi:transcriptional regulator with XRE-family HTH domain
MKLKTKTKNNWYGDVMRELRIERGLTLMDVAEAAKVDIETIRRIELGISMGQFSYVERIFKVLDHEVEIVPINAESENFKRP